MADHWVQPHTKDAHYWTSNPSNRGLFYDWLKDGTYLDHLTGQRGLGAQLAKLPHQERSAAVPIELRPSFPQFDTASLPPAAFLHGALDSLVPPDQSFAVAQELATLGKAYRLEVVEGLEHSLQLADRASGPAGDKDGAMARLMAFCLAKVV